MKIWIMEWTTESSDAGTSGYWDTKPTKQQLNKYIKEHFPDDYEAKTFYYEIIELDKVG